MDVNLPAPTDAERRYQACHECDWLVELPPLAEGQAAECPRCGHELGFLPHQATLRPVVYGLAAVIMLICANLFPFLSLQVSGLFQQMSLYESASVLLDEHHPWLAAVVYLFIQVLPATCLLLMFYLYLGINLGRRLPYRRTCCLWLFRLLPWSMVEVFLVGVLVSLIKIASLAEIGIGYGFWAFVLFALLLLKTTSSIERGWLWTRLVGPAPLPTRPLLAGRALEQGLTSCHSCHALVAASCVHCPRCDSRVHARTPYSLQGTLALLLTAMLLYLPANLLPIMVTESLGALTYSTILGGVVLLWQHGSYPVAMVIFVASVVVPLAKMMALLWLCWSVYTDRGWHRRGRTRLYRLTEFVGRWSMVDVFVVAILVALIRMGKLMSIYPGAAALAFAGVVVLTMLAAMWFDPRLIWDAPSAPQTTQGHDGE